MKNTLSGMLTRALSLLLVLVMVLSIGIPADAIQISEPKVDKASISSRTPVLSPQNIEEGYISNTYIEAYINRKGYYTIGTREGDPNSDTDDDCKLTYGHPNADTSETLVRIDGRDYNFHQYLTDITFDEAHTQCVATAMIDGIEVQQILTLATNPYTNINDLISICYTYTNTTSYPKQVGIRIMLDTMLGSNDGSPFRVNGNEVTHEIEYSGNDVPQYWQSFDSLSSPNVTATGFFYFNGYEKPDKVQFAYWWDIVGSSWDYSVSENKRLISDSAVAAYFNPRTIAAGGSNSVVTYYGVSGFSGDNSDLEGEVSMRVTAPSTLYGSDLIGGYLNNPFDVTVYLDNPGRNTLTDVRAVLSLEGAPQLYLDQTQSTTFRIGNMSAGSSHTIQWTLRALPQGTSSEAAYFVSLYSGDRLLKTMPLYLRLNELNESDMYRTVTFDLNGGSGSAPAAQRVLIGTFVNKPQDPTRSGYVFDGWYANRSCTGLPWFNFLNFYAGSIVTEDVTLYARWREDTQTINYFSDTYQFENAVGDFFSGARGTYAISGDYYDVLLDDLGGWWIFGEKQRIKDEMKETWGGSCFGMSAVLSLIKAGDLDTAFFQAGANTTYALDHPRDDQTIFNLINYYHLMQLTDRTKNARMDHNSRVETENNKAIVEAVRYSDYPVVIGFDLFDSKNTRIGGHAVVGYACTQVGSEYHISIWDPNDSITSNTLRISTDYSTSSFSRNYDTSARSSYMKYALTVEDGHYDYKNIQEALINLGRSSGAETNAVAHDTSDGRDMSLTTNYHAFWITGNDGTYARIENGMKMEGDIEITDADYLNNVGFELELNFLLRDAGDVAYTIIPAEANSVVTGEPLSAYSTALFWGHTTNGFYASVDAADNGHITFGADGTVSTDFESATDQSITVTPNDAATKWYAVTVEGLSVGLTVVPDRYDTFISSLDDTSITVSAENDYNSVIFEEVDLSADSETTLTEDFWNPAIAVIDDQQRELGNSLIFYTRGGTIIEAQRNIPSGGHALRPTDPTREGFVFDGWYTTVECADGDEWNFATPIEEDTRIYAKWLVDDNYTHNITFRAEGHDDVIITVFNGDSLTAEDIPDVPYKIGYTGAWDITDFSNITSDLLVNAVYTSTGISGENPFTDVPEGTFYYDPVLWAVANNITNGTSETTFSPGDPCLRAQIVTFLWRAAGSPEPVSSNNPFVDVKESDFFYKAVLWAVENNITNGMDATHFGPMLHCNRAQVVTFLWRFQGMPEPSGTNMPFTDVVSGTFYEKPVLWALENSITNGISETVFGINSICNRAQIVTFLYRIYN